MIRQYQSKLCRPVAVVPGCHHLRSARRGQLYVSLFRLKTYVAVAWNGLFHMTAISWISLYTKYAKQCTEKTYKIQPPPTL